MTDLLSVRDTAISLSHPDKLYIGGEWVPPQSGSQFAIIDSATEDVFYHVAETGPGDMDAAIAAARHTFDNTDWAFLDPRERAGYLRRIAQR
ncbi:MAG: aldehyde dehydrogenase family protein, partial [Microbacterium sp.]